MLTQNIRQNSRRIHVPLFADRSLELAYQEAESVTKEYSKSFYLASALLPTAERSAIRALYGFCRYTDNIVDDPQEAQYAALAKWRLDAAQHWHEQEHPILKAWAHTREQWSVPQVYANELMDGCEMDLTLTRYQTWEQLEYYCYCVASTVGLMAMHILGTQHDQKFHADFVQAKPYAIKLGVALQLTNILRDVGEDAQRGRIYLPQEDLARFGISDEDILEGRLNEPMSRLLKFEIERAYHLYEEAWPGIRYLAKNAHFSVAVAADVYRGILAKIAANGYNVFTERAYLTGYEKLSRLPSLWVKTQMW